MAFICPCYALVELSSFLFVLILLGYILVDVFAPTILARDLAIVLQLFFFLLSACLVLPLPFVPAHFPCMVLWSFIFLHVGFLLHQALISHYCTIGQKIFLKGHSSLSVAWVLFPPLFLTLGLAIVNTL